MESLWKLKKTLRKEALLKEIESAHERSRFLLPQIIPFLPPKGMVLSYASMKGEVSSDLLNKFLLKQERLALPKIIEGKITPIKIDKSTVYEKSLWGVLEPSAPFSLLSSSDIACVIVPGLLFDKTGNRMGRGMGCYDAFLSYLKCPKIGVLFKELLHSHIPIEPHDEKLDHLVVL